jgi:hypothetical protein
MWVHLKKIITNRSVVVSTLAIVLAPSVSVASYVRPVSQQDLGTIDVQSILQSQYRSHQNLHYSNIPDSVIDSVLKDSEHRIGAEFQVPQEIRNSVEFWLRIYTQYSTQQAVIFDSHDQNLIYEVVDLRPIVENSKNAILSELNSKHLVKKTLKRYQQAFTLLAKNPHPRHPSKEQEIILNQIRKLNHRHTFKELESHMKVMIGQRDNIVNGLAAAESYFPKMEAIFERMGLPKELLRLCLVESSFNLKAYSRVGAAGIWQFMPASGKSYLIIDEDHRIDERLSPFKATVAAGKHLMWNRKFLGGWPLAIIAYNHGPRGLPRFRGKDKYDFSKISTLFNGCVRKPKLGWASRNYYSEFLAIVYAEAYRNQFYGETGVSVVRPVTYFQLEMPQTALSVAIEKGVSLHEFHQLNSDVRNLNQVLPKGFWIAVPGEKDDINHLVEAVIQGHHKKHQKQQKLAHGKGRHQKAKV